MGFESTSSGVAASIFLGLYTLYLFLTINIVRQRGFRSIYTALLAFGVFRVGGQLCGVAFAVLGIEHWPWLIAYLVLTAEGYFALIIAAFYFIVQCQIKQNGRSWLCKSKEERKKEQELSNFKHTSCLSWSAVFHMVLIPANALVISGGTTLTGVDTDKWDQETDKINTSKGLRTTGQAIFLIQTIIVILLLIYVYVKEKVRGCTIYLLFAASPFLLVRGIFGIMSIFIDEMNYYQLSNYDRAGLTSAFIAYEYCLATTMEFIAASLFISNYYLDKTEEVTEKESYSKFESDESSLSKV